MAINVESHNWSRSTKVTVEYSDLNRISTSQHLLPRFRDHWQRRGGKTMKSKDGKGLQGSTEFSGHNREVTNTDSQKL